MKHEEYLNSTITPRQKLLADGKQLLSFCSKIISSGFFLGWMIERGPGVPILIQLTLYFWSYVLVHYGGSVRQRSL